jgi:organic hydroperoxide reductase OsmC/OhrA
VHTEGTLDRVDGMLRFTQFATHARLQMLPGADAARGKLLLEKAETSCLVSNSLNAKRSLTTEVV